MSQKYPLKYRKVIVVLLVSGLAIYIPTQLAGHHYSDNQWHPSWSYYVYLSGIVLFLMGIGLGLFMSFSRMLNKDKSGPGP